MATPEERRRAAKIGGLSLHAYGDSGSIAARARRGLENKFRREADPDGVLTPRQLERKVRILKSLYYTRLALSSAKARRARKERRSGR